MSVTTFETAESRRIYKALRRLARGMRMHVETGELCDECRARLAERIKAGPLPGSPRR